MKYKEVYDKRWSAAKGTKDESILVFDSPKTINSFFYLEYNRFIAKIIRENFADCSKLRLLEIGCGRGTSSIYQAKTLGLEILPTDYSEVAVEIAQNNLDKHDIKAQAKVADLFNLPFDDKEFDIVISLGVMEHIPQVVEAYSEMSRVLKKGGVMISMNVPEKPDNIQRYAAPFNKCLKKIDEYFKTEDKKPWLDKGSRSQVAGVYRSPWKADEFAEASRNSGYKKVEQYELNPFPTIDPLPAWGEHGFVLLYQLILKLRKLLFKLPDPFLCSSSLSRVHFIVAKK